MSSRPHVYGQCANAHGELQQQRCALGALMCTHLRDHDILLKTREVGRSRFADSCLTIRRFLRSESPVLTVRAAFNTAVANELSLQWHALAVTAPTSNRRPGKRTVPLCSCVPYCVPCDVRYTYGA